MTQTTQLSVGLNDSQRLAIETLDRPTLVLAGAGTGKTFILSRKYCLTARSAPLSAIAAITFTKHAAKELQSRLEQELTVEGIPVEKGGLRKQLIGTFHHVANELTKRATAKGFYGFVDKSMLDEGGPAQYAAATLIPSSRPDALKSNASADEPVLKKRFPIDQAIRTLLADVDRIKNMGLLPIAAGYLKTDGSIIKIAAGLPTPGSRAHRNACDYQERLERAKKSDYNDILFDAIRLLRDHRPEIAGEIAYVLIDEYQDTNTIQEEFIRVLTGDGHLTCVGDDDQSIYTWRGARIENMLSFPKRHTEALVVTLDVNYRCPEIVLKHALRLVEQNDRLDRGRMTKNIKAAKKDPGAEITVHDIASDYPAIQGCDLASLKTLHLPSYTAEIIENIIAGGTPPGDIICLARSNAEIAALEDALDARQIKTRIPNPNSVSSPELHKVTAWLRLLEDPNDRAAAAMLTRSNPGDSIFSDMAGAADQSDIPFMEFLLDRLHAGKLKTQRFRETALKYQEFKALAAAQAPLKTIEAICMYEVDKIKSHRNTRLVDLFWRTYANLLVILDQADSIKAALDYMLNDLSDDELFAVDVERAKETVDISTIHSVKGRQKPCVVISGFIDGILPTQQALNRTDKRSLAEERRLAYVAMTRAKDHLHIITAGDRPSIFLTDAALTPIATAAA